MFALSFSRCLLIQLLAASGAAGDLRQCTLWTAPSTLPNAGRGIFGKPQQHRSVVLQLPSRLAELSSLSSYVFATTPSHGEAMSQVMLGPGSLVNHGTSAEQVNCQLQLDEEGFGILRPTRELVPGEELFISYGTSEWFTDRGLISEVAKAAESTAEFGGHCLSYFEPDPESHALLAASKITAEEKVMMPAFLIPSDVAHESMLPYAMTLEEVILLPLWPGRLGWDQDGPANVKLEVLADGLPLHAEVLSAQRICDSPGMHLEVVMTALRNISKGEQLVAQNCKEGCLFPRGWATHLASARQAAAEAGDVWAQFQLAQRWRQGVPEPDLANSTEALAWYLRAAKQSHTAAMLQLGALLHDGDSLYGRNASSAFQWYLEAAKRGSATGQFLVGLAYSNGDGIGKNMSEASRWLSQAASQGSSNFAKASKAMYNLAIAYREGLGIAQDVEKAFYWCRKAAEKGDHDKAMFNLAVAYSRGDGTAVNLTEATKWYHRAADMGHTMARYNLGYFYLVGQGVGQSATLAAEWFQRAAEGNSSNGQFMMGLLHSQGRGVTINPEMAVQWYRRAAQQEHGQAQYNLAAALEAGNGAARNQHEADYWYEKAAVHGYSRPKNSFRGWWGSFRSLFSSFSSTSGKEL